MPAPCRGHNVVNPRILWLPTKFCQRLLRRCNEPRRIAGSTRPLDRFYMAPNNFFTRLDHFSDRRPVTDSEIVDAAPAGLECQHVSLRQVKHVNVVSNTSAIRCRIIGTQNLASGRLSE